MVVIQFFWYVTWSIRCHVGRQEFDLGTLYYIHVHIFPNVHLSLYIHVGVT